MNNQPRSYLKNYIIAGIPFSLKTDFSYDYEKMRAFEVDTDEEAAFTVCAVYHDSDDEPASFGPAVFSSGYMAVYESGNLVCFSYKTSPDLNYCIYDAKEHKAEIVIRNEKRPLVDANGFSFEDHFFFAIRDVFFYYCQQQGMISLHSSSIIYNGRAYLFSAPSGTGKTTHTNLWEQCVGAKPLNGDVAMLSVKDSVVYVHGMPWCGTSEKYSNVTVPLGHIVFLKRAGANEVSVMNSFEAILNVCSRSFSPNWSKALSGKTLNTAKEIVRLNPCLLLKCLPEKSAMEEIKNYIDSEKSR